MAYRQWKQRIVKRIIKSILIQFLFQTNYLFYAPLPAALTISHVVKRSEWASLNTLFNTIQYSIMNALILIHFLVRCLVMVVICLTGHTSVLLFKDLSSWALTLITGISLHTPVKHEGQLRIRLREEILCMHRDLRITMNHCSMLMSCYLTPCISLPPSWCCLVILHLESKIYQPLLFS